MIALTVEDAMTVLCMTLCGWRADTFRSDGRAEWVRDGCDPMPMTPGEELVVIESAARLIEALRPT